jgi:hypothetical protein
MFLETVSPPGDHACELQGALDILGALLRRPEACK